MYWLNPSCTFEKDKVFVCRLQKKKEEEEKEHAHSSQEILKHLNLIKTTPKHTLH